MYNHFVFWWVWSRKEIVALLITFLPIYGWTVTLSCFQSPNFYFNSETAQCLLMKTQSVPGIIWTRIRFAVCLRRVRTACVTFVLYVHMKPSFYIIKKMTEAEGTFCSPATVAARTRESSIINNLYSVSTQLAICTFSRTCENILCCVIWLWWVVKYCYNVHKKEILIHNHKL